MAHLGALLKQLHDFGVDVEGLRDAHETVRDFGDFVRSEAGVNFVFWFVFAVMVGSPIVRQSSKLRHLGEFARFDLVFLVFFADAIDDGIGGNGDALGVDLPELGMLLDAVVEERLRDGGVVDFAVAVAAIADQIDDDIGVEFSAIFGGQAADTNNSVGVLGIYVKNRDALAFGEIRGEARGVLLRGTRGEANQVVNDDVNGAADGI